jgi:hypothetical protein
MNTGIPIKLNYSSGDGGGISFEFKMLARYNIYFPPPPGGTEILPEYIHYYYYYLLIVYHYVYYYQIMIKFIIKIYYKKCASKIILKYIQFNVIAVV